MELPKSSPIGGGRRFSRVGYILSSPRLEHPATPLYCGRSIRSSPMLALYIILGFVVVIGVINVIEFGRVD